MVAKCLWNEELSRGQALVDKSLGMDCKNCIKKVECKNQISEVMKMKKCCLCGKSYEGYGNSASPLKDGRCCDDCNIKKVIPRRLEISKAYGK